MTALNKDNLTPFHMSILSGNTPVARFFLSRRANSSEGCHPSKASADGRTPLQLAIASGSVSTVELVLKDATVHDVERCWEQTSLPPLMKEVLETKVRFHFVSVDQINTRTERLCTSLPRYCAGYVEKGPA